MLLCMHNAHISTVYNTAYCMDEKLPHVKHLYIYASRTCEYQRMQLAHLESVHEPHLVQLPVNSGQLLAQYGHITEPTFCIQSPPHL